MQLTFGYTVGDGRGGTAHAAGHRHRARARRERAPRCSSGRTAASVEVQGRVTTAVLGDWVDPDGDPFFLRSATVAEPDALSSTAEGIVVFDEQLGAGATRDVSPRRLRRPRRESTGVLTVAVKAPGDVPLVAEPFVALATAGEEIRIDPLRHVRGGSGHIRLSAVPAKPDVQLTPDFDGGTLPLHELGRAHALPRVLRDRWHGHRDGPGPRRRVRPARPRHHADHGAAHGLRARSQQPVDVDVLATDIDPTGGVLIVTGVTDPADDEGVRVEVIDHRVLRVTLTRPLATGSTTFGYRVSNGLAEAEGVVTVVEVPPPESYQPPVAAPDTISARTGDVVDIGVLDNDEHPDALPLTLAPDLISGPGRRAPVRRRRPAALLRSRSGGGVRGDLPRRRVRRAVRHGHRAHLGARGRPRDQLGARAARPSPRA